VHVVRDGESLYAIARRYRMSVPELAALNGIRPSGFLLPGQGLRVPLTRAINARAGQPALAARDSDGESAVLGASSEGASATYLVQAGDTLYGIATRYGLDIEGLKARNGLPLDGAIRAGETLVLGDVTPQPRATDEAPTGGQPAQGGAGGEKSVTYVVQPGDTLTDIAGRYGATAQALRAMNGLSGDMISAGQRLSVPRQGSNQPLGYGAKRIEVDIGEQRMYVWEGDTLVYNWTISTGLATHPTRRGTFAVQSKIPNAWSSPWQLWMPNWLGIYWAGGSENGIHALPIINGTRIWGGYLGSPISYGCVVLDTYASQLLYTWAEIGTPVDIHD
jgi:LysM repeat protein